MNEIVRSSLHLTLAWPPSLSAYYRPIAWSKKNAAGKVLFSGAKLVRTRKARLYRDAVIESVRKTMGPVISPFTSHVRLEVELREPDARRRDADNFAKAIQDSLVWAGVLADDSLIRESTCAFGQRIKGGQVVVIITEL
jgi:Holliday junction resolvase RusA-like endonuclease